MITEAPSACKGCGENIAQGSHVQALNNDWHPKCFRCSACGKRLDNWYSQNNGRLYCRRDYWAKFKDACNGCSFVISGPVMVAGDHKYHPECFQCCVCQAYIGDAEPYALVERSFLYCGECYNKTIDEKQTLSPHLHCTLPRTPSLSLSPPTDSPETALQPSSDLVSVSVATNFVSPTTPPSSSSSPTATTTPPPPPPQTVLTSPTSAPTPRRKPHSIQMVSIRATTSAADNSTSSSTSIPNSANNQNGDNETVSTEAQTGDKDKDNDSNNNEDDAKVDNDAHNDDDCNDTTAHRAHNGDRQHQTRSPYHVRRQQHHHHHHLHHRQHQQQQQQQQQELQQQLKEAAEAKRRTQEGRDLLGGGQNGEESLDLELTLLNKARSGIDGSRGSWNLRGKTGMEGRSTSPCVTISHLPDRSNLQGLLVGDRILEVNGDTVRDKSLEEISHLLTHNPAPLTVTLERDLSPLTLPPDGEEGSKDISSSHDRTSGNWSGTGSGIEGGRSSSPKTVIVQDTPVRLRPKNNLRAKGHSPSRRRSKSPSPCPSGRQKSVDLSRSHSFTAHGQHRVFRANDLLLGDILGQGFFGQAIKAVHRVTGEIMVLKELHNFDDSAQKSFLREVSMLRNVSHPCVLKFLGVLYRDKKLNLVTEFIDGGTLSDLLLDQNTDLGWRQRVAFARDIASGMSYLHSVDIIHRDLNSQNCLVRKDQTVVVADFGLAKICPRHERIQRGTPGKKTPDDAALAPIGEGSVNGSPRGSPSPCTSTPPSSGKNKRFSRRKRQTVVGNPYWMAPEMMKEGVYDEKVDVFSFGIIVCETIARVTADPDYLPRSIDFGLNVTAFHKRFCQSAPEPYVMLAVLCCQLEPDCRPSFEKIETLCEALSLHVEHNMAAPIELQGSSVEFYQRTRERLYGNDYKDIDSCTQAATEANASTQPIQPNAENLQQIPQSDRPVAEIAENNIHTETPAPLSPHSNCISDTESTGQLGSSGDSTKAGNPSQSIAIEGQSEKELSSPEDKVKLTNSSSGLESTHCHYESETHDVRDKNNSTVQTDSHNYTEVKIESYTSENQPVYESASPKQTTSQLSLSVATSCDTKSCHIQDDQAYFSCSSSSTFSLSSSISPASLSNPVSPCGESCPSPPSTNTPTTTALTSEDASSVKYGIPVISMDHNGVSES